MVALVALAAACSPGEAPPAGTRAADTRAADTRTADPRSTAPTGPPPLAEGWPAIHHDARNSDTSPAPAHASFELAFRVLEGWRTIAIPAVAGDVVLLAAVAPEGDCRLVALDARDGSLRWCSDAVTGTAFGSTPVVDADGNVYIGDDTAMVSLAADGTLRWRTPVEGLPISAQLTAAGEVLLSTHIGVVLLLDRTDGSVLATHRLLPELRYEGDWAELLDCPQARAGAGCPAANTPAFDDATRTIYLTLNRPDHEQGSVIALRDTGAGDAGEPSRLVVRWERAVLAGGGAGSPTLSADGRRVYVTDRKGGLLSLDATTGDTVWRHPVGYAAGGSPSVADDGLIVPAGGRGATQVIAIRELGDAAGTDWERADLVNRGLVVQPAGPFVYAVTAGPGAQVELTVLDRSDGSTVSQVALPGAAIASMGTAVGPDGWVYVSTPLSGLYALRPSG